MFITNTWHEKNHSLVAITGVVNLLVTECPRPARVAGTREATMPRRVAVTLDAGSSLTGLAAWLHPLAQPPSVGALCSLRARTPQPSPQILELPIDVKVTEAAMEAGAVTST